MEFAKKTLNLTAILGLSGALTIASMHTVAEEADKHVSLPDAQVLNQIKNVRGPYTSYVSQPQDQQPVVVNTKIGKCDTDKCQTEQGTVLVKFKNSSSVQNVAARGGSADALLAGAKSKQIFPNATAPKAGTALRKPNGTVVDAPDLTLWYELELDQSMSVDDALTILEQDSRIERAEANFIRSVNPVEKTLSAVTSNDPKVSEQWYLDDIKVSDAWTWLTDNNLPAGGNRNIVAAVIDTGVDYKHPDLALNMWQNAAEIPNNGLDDDNNGYIDDVYGVSTVGETWSHHGDPMDDHGHGTHVAGIIAARGDNQVGIKGVAHNIKIMAIKAAQYSGVLTSADIAEAVYYAAQNGADIINMSFGGKGRSALEEEALAVAFGTSVLIASAGNDGTANEGGCLPKFGANYPASYNWVLGVMAKAPSPNQYGDYLASFSSWDCAASTRTEYEVMAPGVDILSTLPDNNYGAWDGTSMAAPVVAGMAALLRTRFNDKAVYSSRFIMGQLAQTGEILQGKTYSLNKPPTVYSSANALLALTDTPTPELTYLEHYLWDETSQSSANDDDGIVDAGETINLALIVRNQWGQANDVEVTLSTKQTAAGDDPYVEFITDTVNYGSVGTFSNDDNGLLYDADGVVTGVNKPFSLKVADNTPNNHIIPLVVTFSAKNGLDEQDSTTYTFTSEFSLIVHRGKELPSVLDGDIPGTPAGNLDTDGVQDGVITLNDSSLYIIDKPVLIEKGVTLKLTEGTQVQFWGSQPDDAYAVFRNAYLQVEGSLLVQGSVEKPVQLRPSALFPNRMVVLKSVNAELFEINYADITNIRRETRGEDEIAIFDHVILRRGIENSRLYFQRRSGGDWETDYSSTLGDGEVVFKNSQIKRLGGSEALYNYSDVRAGNRGEFSIRYGNYVLLNNLIDNSYFSNGDFYDNSAYGLNRGGQNNVYLGNRKPAKEYVAASKFLKPAAIIKTDVSEPFSYNGKTYYRIRLGDSTWQQTQAFLDTLDVEAYMAVLSDENEKNALFDWLNELKTAYPYTDFYSRLGYVKNSDGVWSWYNQQAGINLDNEYNWINRLNQNIDYLTVHSWGDGTTSIPYYNNKTSYTIIELESDIGKTNLKVALENYAIEHFQIDNQFNNNAFLNRYWDANPDHWLQISTWKPDEYIDSEVVFEDFRNNYWGTTSKTLIDYVVYDYNDDFNLNRALVEPYLTVPSESTYPFVWKVELLDADGNERSDGRFAAETMTWKITFNRDMDQSVQPSVTFGPEEPYTDFNVYGDWLDARTWQGQVKISPVASDGYQYVRVQGAVAADDAWLVTGNDYARFRFEVINSGTESLNLQASGGDGYVNLSWTQDDYELLHGFNIYRSTTVDGGFTRIHQALIGNDQREYRDENVEPGVTYYYYFTVVSEVGESEPSNTDSATPTDTIKPVIEHSEITQALYGANVSVQAKVTDNIKVEKVTLYYRIKGQTEYQSLDMITAGNNMYSASINADFVKSPGIEYYILATDGDSVASAGRADTPVGVFVDDNPVVSALSPLAGAAAGGTTVTLTGANFKQGMQVKFGETACLSVNVIDANQANCLTDEHFPGVTSVSVINTDGKHSKLVNAYTFIGNTVSLGVPNVKGANGQSILLPINVSDANGIVSLEFKLAFDAQHLSFEKIVKSNLSSAWLFEVNTNQTGEIVLAGAGNSPINGTGALLYAEFVVKASSEATSNLNITDVLINDGAITAETFSGEYSYFPGYNIAGSVNYWADSSKTITANILLDGQVAQTTTDGSFQIQGVSESAHKLSVAKADQNELSITAYDASLILKHASDIQTLSGYALKAADVNGSGAASALDAFEVLNYAAGLRNLPFDNSMSVWQFDPQEIVYEQVNQHLTEQNFTAILIGDVSGDWNNCGPIGCGVGSGSNMNSLLQTAKLGLINQRVENNNLLIDVYLDTNGSDISSVQLTLEAPTDIELHSAQATSLIKDWAVVTNNTTSQITLAMASAKALSQSGIIATLQLNNIDQVAQLTLANVLLNEDKQSSSTINYADFSNDADQDGVIDLIDAFPLNKLEAYDFDGDGVGNNTDQDDDNDGVLDSQDAFPFDATEHTDTDGDGYGDNSDAFPNNKAEWRDTDGDGIGDNADPDADGDGKVDFTLDINGDGKISLPSDGFIILRHMVGFPAQALATEADLVNATRTKDEMKTLLDQAKANGLLDINGDDKVSLPSDGFIILRHMVGFPAQALATDADMVGATRTKDKMKVVLDGMK